jgi:hypothetical protein
MASITTWIRLEPQSRDAGMTDGLKVEVRDPLWLLARQWQIGEFAGHDAGSPTQASYQAEYAPLTAYAPTVTPAPAPIPIDPGLPLEVHVERETVSLGQRASVQLGLHFERLLRQSAVPNPAQLIDDMRAAPRYAIPADPADPPYDQVPDPAGTQFNAAVHGRVTDGWALYTAAKATLPSQPPGLPASAQAEFAQLLPILEALVAYGDTLYSEPPPGDTAWSPHPPSSAGACDIGWLHYDFAVGSQSDMADLALRAPEFPGGHLDWYDFTASAGTLDIPNPAKATTEYRTILPTHVTFRGMPTGSWWTFEDGLTDFGQLTTDLVDLAMPLVTEFAVVYGGNWIPLIPEQADTGGPQFLRRGAMVRRNPAPPPPTVPVAPRGRILQPDNPLFLRDQAIPRAGLQVQRYFRRTRWTDGSTHVWIARRVLPGHGPGQSGLAFDVVVPAK